MNGAMGQEYNVVLDNQAVSDGKIALAEDGWNAGFMVDRINNMVFKTIRLKTGKHIVTILGEGPEVPFIERIRIAEKEEDARLSAKDYISVPKNFSAEYMAPDYLERKAKGEIELNLVQTASAPDPEYEYSGTQDVSFNSSLCWPVYLTAGQNVEYKTLNSTVDPVMYIFLASNPEQYSWSNDDGGPGYESRIEINPVPITGNYYVVLRKYSSGGQGTGELWRNYTKVLSGVKIGGTMVYCGDYSMPYEEKNCFTAKPGYYTGGSTYDTRLFVMPGWTSPITAYNDDYYGSGNFNWGSLSRIKQWITPEPRYCLITHFFSNMSATVDVYAKCRNATEVFNLFPNFKDDDAIKSSHTTAYWPPDYNCIGWSGGLTQWVIPFSTIAEFDDFYANELYPYIPRYEGAEKFTRTGATYSNSVLDLWKSGASFKHATVKKPSNMQMHGYDWESKLGSNIRVFHPREAFNGSGYGSISNYYISNGFSKSAKMEALGIDRPLTLNESIKLGINEIDKAVFSEEELSKLTGYIEKIPTSVSRSFNEKFDAWRKTWDKPPVCFMSHTRDYARSGEYEDFVNFCKKQGKTVWPLLFTSFKDGNLFLVNVFEDLVHPGREDLMEEVKREFDSNRYTADGTYIVHSMESEWRKFCKKVLEREFN